MTIESLRGLDLVSQSESPIPESVATFYQDNIALGTGPSGTYRMSDFFGTAAGVPGNQVLQDAITFITQGLAAGTLTALDTIYGQMRQVVTDGYGAAPSIVIPSGPAAGTYSTYDAALLALIDAANAAIATVAATSSVEDLNAGWTEMAKIFANEAVNQGKATIDYATMSAAAQLPVSTFITSIDSFGQDTSPGGTAAVLEALADITTQAGQALIGAMREGRNNTAIDSANLGRDNRIPLGLDVAQTSAVLDSDRTVAQAQSAVATERGRIAASSLINAVQPTYRGL